MQFKYPEILYALILLIIPILVHLFQLQRFVKVPFTNVQFLKKIELQTRKSSQLKKWLILITRMLALACLIIAFAQPYFSKFTSQQNFTTTIFLDNSFSMQAKGKQGELLKSIAQQIIENTGTQNQAVSLITNTDSYKNLEPSTLKNELINLQYSTKAFDLNSALIQLNKENNTQTNTLNKNILISDFQNINSKRKSYFTNVNTQFFLLQASPENKNNIYIDSVYFSNTTFEEITLNVVVNSMLNNDLNIPVSLFESDKLIGKTMAKFSNNTTTIVPFTIPNTSNFKGKISILDPDLTFDNDFYFTISKPSKINVLSIGNSSNFLSKIYNNKEFNYTTSTLQNLNYNNIQNQQLIVLNELDFIPNELIKILTDFVLNGNSIVIIPSQKTDIASYNQLLYALKLGKIINQIEAEHKITTINYQHPLIKNVFEKQVSNFKYPTTNLYYKTQFNFNDAILTLDNNNPFIASLNNNVYWIASPLNTSISNFTQSPLVIPIFYNFAIKSIKTNQLYYTINANTTIEIATNIGKDEVLKISNGNTTFIPLQKVTQNKVILNIENNNLQSGFYTVLNNNNVVETIALNYNTSESKLNYTPVETLAENTKNVTVSGSVDEIFKEINNQHKINWLFKWFLAFSALFLFLEMLILKYFKI
jgi:hypothetical protein